jgi:hypothetical protein
MPFKIIAEQKRFKFELSSAGLPIADVERMGTVFWVMCCPLCGCIHDLSRQPETVGEFEPKCLLPRTHKSAYVEWVTKQPTAPAYTRISLRQRQGDVIPLDTPAERTRKAA